MYLLKSALLGLLSLTAKITRALLTPAALVCLGMSMYNLYSNNFFTAIVFIFMANMIVTESRYREIKRRLDVQEYL